MNNPLLSKEHCDYIKVSVESDLATVTLDRVEKRNAFNLEMWKEIKSAFTSLDKNKAPTKVRTTLAYSGL